MEKSIRGIRETYFYDLIDDYRKQGEKSFLYRSFWAENTRELLKECHEKMDGTKAVGIDGMTKEEYGRELERNLDELVERLKQKSYRPQPARQVEIPKENGKTRPLSIYCYEDKLVQEALRRVLEAVYEPQFYDEMWGFRPNRGCHKAIQRLNMMLEKRPTNYVLDADIKVITS